VRIAVVAGGRTPERDVSSRTGHRVAGALAELGHEVWQVDPADVSLTESLRERTPDLCWLALHGKEGEDGTIQRLLDLLGLPYTGPPAFECEIAFDKVLAKDALLRAGAQIPDWVVVDADALRDLGAGAALGTAVDRVGLPCVVKPSRSGSALGVGFVERESDLPPSVMAALSFSGAAIVESKIEGTEVAAGLVGDPLVSLPLVEIEAKGGVYDYAARYTAGATEYFAPARLTPDEADRCVVTAERAAATLGFRDLTRVDMIVDGNGAPWILDAKVSPGMTETSLLPMGAHAAGMSLAQLCERILASAGRRG
jgi:D-alanine-D-alanine ligase